MSTRVRVRAVEIAQLWRSPKRGFGEDEAGQRLRMRPLEGFEVEELNLLLEH